VPLDNCVITRKIENNESLKTSKYYKVNFEENIAKIKKPKDEIYH
jgi:hypothetical protein